MISGCIVLFLSILLPCSVLGQAVKCTEQNKADFLQRLTRECAAGLTNLEMRGLPQRHTAAVFVPSASALNEVCCESCAGAYADWLRVECADPFAARMVEGMCIFTANTASAGPRCRFAFPDAVADLRGSFARVFSCVVGESPGTCPIGCKSAMTALIDDIGCCYPSLYNNTMFLKWMQNTGLINDTLVHSAEALGKAPEWNLCVTHLPPMCEVMQSEPSSALGIASFAIANLLFVCIAHLCV